MHDRLARMMSRTSGAWTRSGSTRLLLLLLAAALLFAVAHPAAAAPASNRSFVWDRIDVTVLLRPDASFHVIELARVVFGGGPFLEGYREIPLARIERIDHVRVSDVSPEGTTPLRAVSPRAFSPATPNTYATEIVGTNERIEWSFSPTTSRARTFLIEYDVYGALRVYDDAEIPYQQISWAGVGRELTRDARVNHASLTFVLPRPVDPDRTVVAGPGSTEPRDHTKDGQTWLWQDSGLAGGESLEATLQFEPLVSAGKPSWQDASDRQELGGASQLNPLLLGLALLVAVGGSIATFAAWWTRGRDPAAGLAPQLLATPPSDLPPGVVGALLDESVDTRDIVATLIDLARRGVLRIEHRAIQGSRGGSRLVVTLLDPYAADAPFEEALLATLFAGRMTPGAWSSLPGEGDRYRAGMERVRRLLGSELVARGFFAARPARTRAAWQMAGGALMAVGVGGLLLAMGFETRFAPGLLIIFASLLLVGLIVWSIAPSMPRKTQAGADTAAQWRAFKRYLAAIEQYAELPKAQELFDRYLPYAIAFGIEQSWVRAFAHAAAPSPAWYGPVNTGRLLRAGGRVLGAPGGMGNAGGVPSLPGSGLQGASDALANSLQQTSDSLFAMFNAAGESFSLEPPGKSAPLTGAGAGFRFASVLLKAASGGGGGGFR